MLVVIFTLGMMTVPPKPPLCELFCSVTDPQGWLLKPHLAISSLPFLALALLRALSLTHTRARAQCVSIHTPLCFSFLFGCFLLYCFKLVAGLTASLNFICLSSSPPPPLPLSSPPPSPEVILFTFSAAFSMSLYALQGI